MYLPAKKLAQALQSFGYSYNPFYNEYGLFGAAQGAFPAQDIKPTRKERIMEWGFLMNAITIFKDTDSVLEKIAGIRLSHGNIHYLFADPQNAVIAEPGSEANMILPLTGNYLVATNFYNHLWENASPVFRESLDADQRYRIANHMIESSFDDFGYKEGLNVLAGIKQATTKFSVVVLPKEQLIYFTIFGDFNRVWQVDFVAETIATYSGFLEERVEVLDSEGILVYELSEWR